MNRKVFITTVIASILAGTAFAAPKKTYKYKCNKCHLVQEYTVPGVKRCPNDGSIMIRIE